MTGRALRIDVFCAVIDNFGDAGVCWRLARQLAREHGASVRLWIDRPEVLAALQPDTVPGVHIGDWANAAASEAADLVIEAFACTLPDAYVEGMASRSRQPVWINLEYLSAEDWVAGCHGLPSPQSAGPGRGLRKFFFFPGFTAGTGGLLREAGLLDARRAFRQDAAAQSAFWQAQGLAPAPDALKVSLFGYENPALPALLDAWAMSPRPVFCALPTGRLLPQVAVWSGQADLTVGTQLARGALRLAVLPFLAQHDYDRLLWACDLNFVRGEDSFVRAQWAAQAFVWHIYPQAHGAHQIKLDAFLAHYTADLSAGLADPLRNFWHGWNSTGEAAAHWPALATALPGLKAHAENRAERVAKHGDLTSRLLIFYRDLLE